MNKENDAQKQRALDMHYLFSEVLPTTNNDKVKEIEKSLNAPFSDFIKQLIIGISVDGVRAENWGSFLSYMKFINEATGYILDGSNPMPTVYQNKTGYTLSIE